MKNIWVFRGERRKNQKNGLSGEKWPDRKGKRTRQKNERGDRKEESNDSPEIPDKGRAEETLNIPGLPSGVQGLHRHYHHTFWWNRAEWNYWLLKAKHDWVWSLDGPVAITCPSEISPESNSVQTLQKSFRWDNKPMQKDNKCTLKLL